MEYPLIKKYLGEEWLNNQINLIQQGSLIENYRGLTKEKIDEAAYYVLKKIEDFISKFEKLDGFDIWIKQASTSKGKSFDDFIFELISMEVLIKKPDLIQLKVNNNSKETEAYVKEKDIGFFLECTNLRTKPANVSKTVDKLFNKSTKKFEGKEGIHIVGTFVYLDRNTSKPTNDFTLLKHYIRQRFSRGFGSKIIAFQLCNFYVGINPTTGKIALIREYHLERNPRKEKKYPDTFFKNVFEVNEFKYTN